jgi:uncharacterized RDD family membrane protein YckC
MTGLAYAGFWRRAVALWIDSAILNALASVFMMAYLRALGLTVTDVGGTSMQLLSIGAYVCFAFPYYTIAHYRWGFTLGKRLMKVTVVDARTGMEISAGQSIGRTLATVLSYAIFGIGYLMAAWDPQKRALHDRLCSTVCILA